MKTDPGSGAETDMNARHNNINMTDRSKIAFVLKGYPRLSETFIAQEILALEQKGLDISIYSLRHPTDKGLHDLNKKISAPVSYLPEYVWHEPGRVLKGWLVARRQPGYARARKIWTRDLFRDPTPNRIRRFAQAMVLAAELPADTSALYAHFIHTPGSVTRYAAHMRNLPWSVSAHAKDIWTSPEWELREKLDDCSWAVTCTGANKDYLNGLCEEEKVHLVYHGLDFDRFPESERLVLDNGLGKNPIVILSVGRAVIKKGYDVLLTALSQLPENIHWSFVHIGGGPLGNVLKSQADRIGISDRIDWRGAQSQDQVIAACRQADMFVLASRIAEDGDRDGLPNVLMEAQSLEVPCISTTISAIPELIEHDRTGLLVPPESPEELAKAIERLYLNVDLRIELGRAGKTNVRSNFTLDKGIEELMARFAEIAPGTAEG